VTQAGRFVFAIVPDRGAIQRFANGNHSALWDTTTAIHGLTFRESFAIIPDRCSMQRPRENQPLGQVRDHLDRP